MVRVSPLVLLPWRGSALARMQSMTGEWSRVFMAYLLSRSRAAAPLLFHAMGSHRAGSGICLRVHLCDMCSQTVAMQHLSTMTALALPELTRPSVRVFGAMMPLMLFHASRSEASSAELALSILGRRCFHFPMSKDSGQATSGVMIT